MTTITRTSALIIGCLGLALGQGAAAHKAGKATEGFVGDASGHLITDGFGDCVMTGFGSKKNAPADCGGAPARPAAKPAPAPAPAAKAAPAPAPKPKPKMMTKSVSLSAGALFDVNSATLKPAGQAELAKLAEHIRKMSEVQSVAIVGYTDSTGSEAYNKQLSMRRAIAVKNYLLDHGVPANVMSTLGMGEANPVASNATAAGRARNRRVEITIKGSEVHM